MSIDIFIVYLTVLKIEGDLDNVRKAMQALHQLHEMEAVIEMKMQPVSDAMNLMNRFHVPIDPVIAEGFDSNNDSWNHLKALASTRQSDLVKTQVCSSLCTAFSELFQGYYRRELLQMMSKLKVDIKEFQESYENNGYEIYPHYHSAIADTYIVQWRRILLQ